MTIDVLKTLPDSKHLNGSVPVRQSVRRSLFGKVNHEESMNFLQQQMDLITESQKKKWNFDFVKEEPLEPCNYEWTPVTSNDMVPRPYALSRLSYLYEHTENSNITNDVNDHSPASESQPKEVTITKNLKQTLLDGYLKKKKRASTVTLESNKPTIKKMKSSHT